MVRRGGVSMLKWGELMLALTLSGTLTGIVVLGVNKGIGRFFSGNWQCVMLMTAILSFVIPFSSIPVTKERPQRAAFLNQTVKNGYIKNGNTAQVTFQKAKASNDTQLENHKPIKTEEVKSNSIKDEKGQSVAGVKGYMTSIITGFMKKITLQSLWCLWLAGILFYMGRHIKGYHKFIRNLEASCEVVEDQRYLKTLEKVKQDLGMQQPIEMYRCSKVASPMLVGLNSKGVV